MVPFGNTESTSTIKSGNVPIKHHMFPSNNPVHLVSSSISPQNWGNVSIPNTNFDGQLWRTPSLPENVKSSIDMQGWMEGMRSKVEASVATSVLRSEYANESAFSALPSLKSQHLHLGEIAHVDSIGSDSLSMHLESSRVVGPPPSDTFSMQKASSVIRNQANISVTTSSVLNPLVPAWIELQAVPGSIPGASFLVQQPRIDYEPEDIFSQPMNKEDLVKKSPGRKHASVHSETKASVRSSSKVTLSPSSKKQQHRQKAALSLNSLSPSNSFSQSASFRSGGSASLSRKTSFGASSVGSSPSTRGLTASIRASGPQPTLLKKSSNVSNTSWMDSPVFPALKKVSSFNSKFKNASEKSILLQGPLHKCDPNGNNWRLRYVCLTKNGLAYFPSKEDADTFISNWRAGNGLDIQSLKSFIPLSSATRVGKGAGRSFNSTRSLHAGAPTSYTFHVTISGKRTYTFAAMTRDGADNWLDGISTILGIDVSTVSVEKGIALSEPSSDSLKPYTGGRA
jgi:PH domain